MNLRRDLHLLFAVSSTSFANQQHKHLYHDLDELTSVSNIVMNLRRDLHMLFAVSSTSFANQQHKHLHRDLDELTSVSNIVMNPRRDLHMLFAARQTAPHGHLQPPLVGSTTTRSRSTLLTSTPLTRLGSYFCTKSCRPAFGHESMHAARHLVRLTRLGSYFCTKVADQPSGTNRCTPQDILSASPAWDPTFAQKLQTSLRARIDARHEQSSPRARTDARLSEPPFRQRAPTPASTSASSDPRGSDRA